MQRYRIITSSLAIAFLVFGFTMHGMEMSEVAGQSKALKEGPEKKNKDFKDLRKTEVVDIEALSTEINASLALAKEMMERAESCIKNNLSMIIPRTGEEVECLPKDKKSGEERLNATKKKKTDKGSSSRGNQGFQRLHRKSWR